MSPDELFCNGLCEDVGRVASADNLGENEITLADSLLNPKLPNCKMSDLANARPSADADSCTAINTYFKGKVEAQVHGETGHA